MRSKLLSFYKKFSLKNKIFFPNALVMIISLLVLAFFANRISTQVMIDKAEKTSSRELVLVDRNLNTMMNSVEDYARVIASDYRLQDQLLKIRQNPDPNNESLEGLSIKSSMSEIMSNIIAPNTQLVAASVISGKYIIYSGYDVDNSSVYSSIDDSFLDKVLKQQTPVWTGPFKLAFNDGHKEDVFAVAKLVIDRNSGYKTGIVILFAAEKNISKIYMDNKSNESDRFFILDSGNMVISSQYKGDLYKKSKDVIGLDEEKQNELMQKGRLIINQNGRKFLMSLQNFDRLNSKVISIVPLDEIIKENIQIQSIIVIVGIFCLVFAFAASYIISYTVTKPVNRLTKVMKKIVKGDMGVRAETGNAEELAILAEGFNNLMDKIEGLMADIYTEQKAKREFEFQLIQSQIKPHFLYNSLETIISLNKLGRYEDAVNTTKYLANFYRYSLSKGNDIIKIQEEVQLISNYLFIQNMRYSNYMEFEIHVDEKILDFTIPKLTLQPLVENSIYHGLKPRNGKGKLEISGYEQDGDVFIEVKDDGVGIPEEKIKSLLEDRKKQGKNEDFGLGSVNRRIKLMYGNEYGLSIESESGSYTKVTVIIPADRKRG